MESKFKRVMGFVAVATTAAVGLAGEASAASVIDVGMKTALEAGFGDLVDTVKDVIATAWPFILGATVMLAAPGLVQKMIGKATGR